MKTIIFVGVPGVGKSSILQEITLHTPVEVINYGDKMAAFQGIDRDALRKMPFREQQKIGIKAAKNIMEEERNGIVIIDTHALVRLNFGYCPGLPREVLEILSPVGYVLVECSPSIIRERRLKDNKRARDQETEEQISNHQSLTRSFVTACCMHTGSFLCCIDNSSNKLKENVLPFLDFIKTI
jgi:adenylate kinase